MWSRIIPHMKERMIRGCRCFESVCLEVDIRLLKPCTKLNVRGNLYAVFLCTVRTCSSIAIVENWDIEMLPRCHVRCCVQHVRKVVFGNKPKNPSQYHHSFIWYTHTHTHTHRSTSTHLIPTVPREEENTQLVCVCVCERVCVVSSSDLGFRLINCTMGTHIFIIDLLNLLRVIMI